MIMPEHITFKYKWDSQKKDTYLNLLNSEDVLLQLDSVCHNANNAENKTDINENLNLFCTVLDNVCTSLFKRVWKKMNENNSEIENVETDKHFYKGM